MFCINAVLRDKNSLLSATLGNGESILTSIIGARTSVAIIISHSILGEELFMSLSSNRENRAPRPHTLSRLRDLQKPRLRASFLSWSSCFHNGQSGSAICATLEARFTKRTRRETEIELVWLDKVKELDFCCLEQARSQ